MTENEDGFIPVAQCLEALVKPPPIPVSPRSERYIDARRRLYMRVARAAHPRHRIDHAVVAGFHGTRARTIMSGPLHRVLSSCEDLDTLLIALTAVKKFTNNYADQPETR
jgi:hypothetical protein